MAPPVLALPVLVAKTYTLNFPIVGQIRDLIIINYYYYECVQKVCLCLCERESVWGER